MSTATTPSSSPQPPPCRLLFRSKKSTQLHTVNSSSSSNGITLLDGPSTAHAFSPDGSRVVIHSPSTGAVLIDLHHAAATDEQTANDNSAESRTVLEGTKAVQFLTFSSGGSYVVTWERVARTAGAPPPPNLKIWHGETGRYLYGFTVRNMSRSKWPPIRWTHDEEYAFYLAGDGLCVYPGGSFGSSDGEGGDIRWQHKIRCPGLQEFSLPATTAPPPSSSSPQTPLHYLLTTFVPETKSKPARITLLRYSPSSQSPPTETPLASKSFYQAEECAVHWSPRGDSALALTSTTVDTSGSSYYGSTNLYLLLSPKGSAGEGQALAVESGQGQEGGGPVHAVAWNPSPTRTPQTFSVISGRMPARSTTHSGTTGACIFSMGNAHRNTLCYAPHGRFLMVGGFGNLAGGMDFWDVNKEGRCVQWNRRRGGGGGGWGEVVEGAGESKANCAVGYGWSPCSRWLAVCTTSPRMNVENGVTLYRYDGQMVGEDETVEALAGKEEDGEGSKQPKIVPWDREAYYPDRLLSAEWVPAKRGVYPDRPQTPPPKRPAGSASAGGGAVAKTTSTAGSSGGGAAKPVGRYVPPCARRSGGGGGGMDLAERMRREREGGGSSVGRTTGVVGGGGARVPVGMSADKAGAGGKSKNALRKERQREAKKKREAEEAAAAAAEAEAAAAEAMPVVVDPVKRAKKLKKTLKQIAELKTKDFSGLNDDQKRKIASEEAIAKELAELGL